MFHVVKSHSLSRTGAASDAIENIELLYHCQLRLKYLKWLIRPYRLFCTLEVTHESSTDD